MFPKAELILRIEVMNYGDEDTQMWWKKLQPCMKPVYMSAVRVRSQGYARNKKTDGALRLPVLQNSTSARVAHVSERYKDFEAQKSWAYS